MTTRFCPHAKCGHDGSMFKQDNTLTAHFAKEHLDEEIQYYLLTQLIPDFDGETHCTICPIKGQKKSWADLLGHHLHKHGDQEWWDFIKKKYFPVKAGKPKPTAERLREIQEEMKKKVKDDDDLRVFAVPPGRKGPPKAEEEGDDGYQSGASDKGAEKFKQKPNIKNPNLDDTEMRQALDQKRWELFGDEAVCVQSAESFFKNNLKKPNGDWYSGGDYLRVLKLEKQKMLDIDVTFDDFKHLTVQNDKKPVTKATFDPNPILKDEGEMDLSEEARRKYKKMVKPEFRSMFPEPEEFYLSERTATLDDYRQHLKEIFEKQVEGK
jgi:hypothetical protein